MFEVGFVTLIIFILSQFKYMHPVLFDKPKEVYIRDKKRDIY